MSTSYGGIDSVTYIITPIRGSGQHLRDNARARPARAQPLPAGQRKRSPLEDSDPARPPTLFFSSFLYILSCVPVQSRLLICR